MSDSLNVAVVGGGLSGLATAVYLSHQRNVSVTVYEAAPRLGGQAASWKDADGDDIETGIHLAFPWYVNFLRLYQEVGRPLPLIQTDGNYYVLDGRRGKTERIAAGRSARKTLYGLATFPGLSPRERLKLARHVWRVLRMSDADAEAHDGWSVTQFLEREAATPALVRQLSLATMTIQGLRADQTSAASYIKFMRTLYGSLAHTESAFFSAPLEACLIRPLADFIRARGGELHCGTRVRELVTTERRVVSLVTGSSGRSEPADVVVLAVPGYQVPPLLPSPWRQREPFVRLSRLQPAHVITLTLWYDRPVLGDGNVRISNRDGVVFDAVADKARHWTDVSGDGKSVIQVLIDAANDLAGTDDETIYHAVLTDLDRFFPACRSSKPRKHHVLRHRDIYCATHPGYWSVVPRRHETPIENLYLAGDYTDGPYHYGMESAVVSGKETARAVLSRVGQGPLPEAARPPRYLPIVRPARAARGM